MAYPYGTGSGVTGMKKTGRSNTDIHTFIKAGLVILLVVYLTLLYTADNAKNIPIEQITASMESDETITSLNKEERTDLKHYYQVDERDIDGYFFYKAASPIYGCRGNLHHEGQKQWTGCHFIGERPVPSVQPEECFRRLRYRPDGTFKQCPCGQKRKLRILYVRSRRCQLAQCFPRPDITTRLENMNYGI